MRVLFIVKDTDIEHLNIMLLGRLHGSLMGTAAGVAWAIL